MARILVIDDDASLLQMMSLMLKRAGHTPILVSDGQEGLEVARTQHPDLAIVDVMMPDISGYDICSMLREDPRTADIPLLVLTALSQPEQRDIAEESGADDFVTKPVTRDDLVSRVDDLLLTGPRNVLTPAQHPVPPAAASPRPAAVPPPPAGDITAETHPAPPPAPAGDGSLPLVAVMGLSEGAGATTLAVNLGLGLLQIGRSCIVDLNTRGGQVAVHLNMVPPRTTWLNLLELQPGGDKRQIGGALMLDYTAGLGVLAAPLHPAPGRLGEASLHYLFNVLSEGFQRIVVDLPPVLDGEVTAVLRRARHLILVVGSEPTDLSTAEAALSRIDELKLPGIVHLILNRTAPQGVSFEEVIRVLNRPLATSIPFESAQTEAVSRGTPLVMMSPDSLFSKTVLQLARLL